jgi:hypothetical protein
VEHVWAPAITTLEQHCRTVLLLGAMSLKRMGQPVRLSLRMVCVFALVGTGLGIVLESVKFQGASGTERYLPSAAFKN